MTANTIATAQTTGVPGVAPPVELREIDINVTNRCNLKCIYCSYSSTPSPAEPELPATRLLALLDEAASLGTKVIHFSGGEPLTRRDMPDIIAHANALGFKMRMHSNGELFTPERLLRLREAGLRQVLVSLDGSEADHDFLRAKPGLYPKTLAGIRNAVALGFNVRVNSVATTRNVDHLPRLIPQLADLGAATFSVFYLIPVGRGREQRDLMVPPGRWRRFLEEMRSMAACHRPQHLDVAVEKVFLWKEEWRKEAIADGRGGTCLGFMRRCNYVNVLADGRVYPCVCFIDHAPPLGNIHEQPLATLLRDPAAWGFYHRLLEANATCRGCDRFVQCQGGCKALSRTLAGDWFALDPRCTGRPHEQGYVPQCFMARENLATGKRSGFAERVHDEE